MASDATRPSPKETFLAAYEREHQTTMKVLRAYPTERLDLQPHEKCKTARELAWVFVMERIFGETVFRDRFQEAMAEGEGEPPAPPETWDGLLAALEDAHRSFRDLVRATPDAELDETVGMLVGPGEMGQVPRIDWLWFLLHDQIHHRGQFSIYLRMADGKVPAIYGPSADEPWT